MPVLAQYAVHLRLAVVAGVCASALVAGANLAKPTTTCPIAATRRRAQCTGNWEQGNGGPLGDPLAAFFFCFSKFLFLFRISVLRLFF
jgi:hypothetical protein